MGAMVMAHNLSSLVTNLSHKIGSSIVPFLINVFALPSVHLLQFRLNPSILPCLLAPLAPLTYTQYTTFISFILQF